MGHRPKYEDDQPDLPVDAPRRPRTCSMAYEELKTPLPLLLELVEESAELPDGVPLPDVFTVRICSSEKPSWWRSF